MTRSIFRAACAGAGLIALAGCGRFETTSLFEPFSRPGTWVPEGVNQSNLAAQLADPGDMIKGRGDTSPHYKMQSQAVITMWTNKPSQSLMPGLKGGGEAPPGGGPGAAPPPPAAPQ